MKQMLTILALCSVIGVAFVQSAYAKSQTFGQSDPNEKVIAEKIIHKSWSVLVIGRESFWFDDGDHRITSIDIIDQHEDKEHSAEYTVHGGVGTTYAHIQFSSQPYRGIYYKIIIRGVPIPKNPEDEDDDDDASE